MSLRGGLAPPRPGGWARAGWDIGVPHDTPGICRHARPQSHTHTHTPTLPVTTRPPLTQPHTHTHTPSLGYSGTCWLLHRTTRSQGVRLSLLLMYTPPYEPSATQPVVCCQRWQACPTPDVHSSWLTHTPDSPHPLHREHGSSSPLDTGLLATLPAWCPEILLDCCPGPAAWVPTWESDPGPSVSCNTRVLAQVHASKLPPHLPSWGHLCRSVNWAVTQAPELKPCIVMSPSQKS